LSLASPADDRPEVLYEDLCFEAQQAAEKAIKAILVARQREFRRTHDIGQLLDLLVSDGLTVPDEIQDARRLTPYAVSGRYPQLGEYVDHEEWRAVLEIARRVLQWAEATIES
jgi:HEPN domain-containing protein